MCHWPEEHCAEGVERQTHENGDLVSLALEDLTGDGGEAEVTATEVHDLETGRFELGDTESVV